MKKVLRAVAVAALATGLVAGLFAMAAAGSDAKEAKGQGHDMAAMMAEMQKCFICKHMVAAMPEVGPVMKSEVVHLDSGMAMVTSITDPAKVTAYHAVAAEMAKAGEATMKFTPEQVKTQLCSHCQQLVGLAMAGAQISHGMTKDGDILVVTSKDPAVVQKINAYQSECEMMMSSM